MLRVHVSLPSSLRMCHVLHHVSVTILHWDARDFEERLPLAPTLSSPASLDINFQARFLSSYSTYDKNIAREYLWRRHDSGSLPVLLSLHAKVLIA